MIRLGCHLSSSGGFAAMAGDAGRIGANTFQFFTRNPRGGNARAWDAEDLERYRELAVRQDLTAVVAHAPYTLNLCSARPEIRSFALRTMQDDLNRLEQVPGALYNFHPGSHTGQGVETGIAQITDALNQLLDGEVHTPVLLETMTGKGSEVGGRFEELRDILGGVNRPDQVFVCMDTCHVYDAGYDIREHLDDVMETFDRVIGLGKLRAVHVNDTKNPMGSRKDRHEKIGEGTLGVEALVRFMACPAVRDLPMILETPNELEGYAREIRLLRTRLEASGLSSGTMTAH